MSGPSRRASTRALIAALLAASPLAPVAAGSLFIDPVRVELTGDRKIAAIRVVNQESVPVSLRVTALRWDQVAGEDRYVETADIIASPPIFTIPANGAQLLRIGLRDNDAARFRAYRLIVEEIPRPVPDHGRIRVTLRLNLPLYVLPARGKPTRLSWALAGKALEASNPGSVPVQVQRIDAVVGGGERVGLSESMGVVLPGSKRRWRVDRPLGAGVSLHAVARTDFGEQSFQIPPEQP